MNDRKRELRQRIRETANNNRRRRGGRNQLLVVGAEEAMNALKYEMANELGLVERIQTIGYENMTTKECGSIGGMMTKRMIAYAQMKMKEEIEESGSLRQLPAINDPRYEEWGYDPSENVH